MGLAGKEGGGSPSKRGEKYHGKESKSTSSETEGARDSRQYAESTNTAEEQDAEGKREGE